MTSALANALFDLAAASLLGSAAALARRRPEWRILAALGLGSLTAECALAGAWPGVALNGGLLALLLGDWFRRKGLPALRALGAKSRAVLDGLAGKLRDATRAPRQVPA